MLWKSQQNKRIAQLSDFLAALALIHLAFVIWVQYSPVGKPFPSPNNQGVLTELNFLSVFFAYVFVICFNLFEAYNNRRFTSLINEYTVVFKTVLIGSLINIAVLFLMKLGDVPRSLILITVLVVFPGLILEKTLMYFIAQVVRETQPARRILLIGSSASLESLMRAINRGDLWGVEVTGVLVPEMTGKPLPGIPAELVYGTFDDLERSLKDLNPEEVIIAPSASDMTRINWVIEECEKVGVQIRLVSDLLTRVTKNVEIDNVQGINIISYYPYQRSNLERMAKRIIDFTASLILIILLSPLLLLIAVMILIQDGMPVLFTWKVMGFNRKPITSWKFRTMYRNADEMKKELLKFNEMTGPMFKMENDPRVFPVGKILRKYSLDELPQLFSVLIGDLSLVGPRPPLQYEYREFDLWHRRKLSVKPGMTCLWQVSGRNAINDLDEWVRLDLLYIDNWSLWLDFKILFMTAWTVFKGTGK